VASHDATREKLRAVFDAHYEAVSRYCHRRLPAVDANDAAARVFAVAWRKIEEMPTGDAALPWLYGVARYEVGSIRRSARRRRNLQEKLGGQARHANPGPENLVVGGSKDSELMQALLSLRPQDQEVVRLRALEGLSTTELAVAMSCSVEAAKKRSARAMKRLRRAAGVDAPHRATPEPVEEKGST
jgi:RNA polymerase sigma factor (sigma-70 family)